MRTLTLSLALLFFVVPMVGCQSHGGHQYAQQPYSTNGQIQYQQPVPAGYEQSFPPQVGSQPQVRPFRQRSANFLGSLAGGFFRSAVGGAGFSAGRDLWNSIVH